MAVSATYRLQLRGPKADPHGRAFTFDDAAALVPYLAELGISHLYLSPILTAPAWSNHNYDVTDPTEINPELGGREGFERLATTAHDHGLGIIIDIVPNHVGIDSPSDNAWWWDVLTYGEDSRFATYFDIDWSAENGADGRLGIPLLGSPADVSLLKVVAVTEQNRPKQTEGCGEPVRFMLDYYGHLYPVRPGTELEPGDDRSPDDIDPTHLDAQAIHRRQHYELRYWRDGVIGYRRFFSVNGLAGIRQENPLVFEHTHRILRELIASGFVDGVRVDHPDGLADPFDYLTRLRAVIGDHRLLLVEKILSRTEPLDPRLDVDGTTGYDALREFDGVFVSRKSEEAMSQIAFEYSDSRWDAPALADAEAKMKIEVATQELGAEVRRLARAIRRDNWSTMGREVTDEQLADTLTGIISAMPVYRADYHSLSRTTATVIHQSVLEHPERIRAFDLISAGLLGYGEAWVRFAQVCGAVMAKGVEDTTFYRACRLVSLQEVGGAPQDYGLSSAEFHMLQSERAGLWPRSMTTLTTHDTKRSEDTRARIIALTEIPGEFHHLLATIENLNPLSDRAALLFLMQNVVGVWPADGHVTDELRERLSAYAHKALREAGVHTTWTEVNTDYEAEVDAWIQALCQPPVRGVITDFVQRIAGAADIISHSRKILQLLGPGIPDIYQGTEFPDYSLVDPDNRRFVDFETRQAALAQVKRDTELGAHVHCPAGPTVGKMLPAYERELGKIAVVTAALAVRRERPQSFHGGVYLPVFAQGEANRFAVGFGRGARRDDIDVITVVTRHPIGLAAAGGWGETTVTFPRGRWTDRLSGQRWEGTVPVADLLRHAPYGIFVRDTASVVPQAPR